jgi:chromate transport protein ChrA
MLYSIAGTLNSIFIFVSLFGIWSQVKKVWVRKKSVECSETPTELLSLNQFTVSFLAYWSFFVYGYSIRPFNHFIVWPRLIASVLVLVLLYEIFRDRKTRASLISLIATTCLMSVGILGLLFGKTFVDEGRTVSQCLIVAVTLLLAQGYAHQIRLIVLSGKTGAVSLRMSQFILAMDVSTLFFASVMGLETGWPLLLLASVSAATKILIIWLFKWVEQSPVARQRRELFEQQLA